MIMTPGAVGDVDIGAAAGDVDDTAALMTMT